MAIGALAKQARAKQAEREATSKPRLPAVLLNEEAICHPDQPDYQDGICEKCWYSGKRRSKAEKMARRNELLELHRQVEFLQEQNRIAKAYLRYHLPVYAQIHLEGARVAAREGDTRPAEWALSNIKTDGEGQVVDPPAKVAPESGLKVFVGVNIGGLPPQAVDAEIVEIGQRA